MIKIKELRFSYPNGKEIFNDLDFSLQEGEKLGLVGPNGAGKTTLFHIIMGLLRPASGYIEIFGKVRKEEKDFKEVRQRIGLLFQDSDDQLFSPTVEEDIAFGPLNLGKSREEVRNIVRETCEILGLSGFEKRVTHRLSGGEKRLVALATVVAMRPECYLLDEPFSGLDETTTERFLEYLKANIKTCIIIAHDREILNKTVDNICILNKSKIERLDLSKNISKKKEKRLSVVMPRRV
ncbi:MAG: energy-coupling factor ABC transporter ATP-binding protein [Thermodesulfovibrionales bacterium]